LTPAGVWVAEALLAEEAQAATDEPAKPFDLGELDMSSLLGPLESQEDQTNAQ
jgi:hypothetical protein